MTYGPLAFGDVSHVKCISPAACLLACQRRRRLETKSPLSSLKIICSSVFFPQIQAAVCLADVGWRCKKGVLVIAGHLGAKKGTSGCKKRDIWVQKRDIWVQKKGGWRADQSYVGSRQGLQPAVLSHLLQHSLSSQRHNLRIQICGLSAANFSFSP